MKSVRNCGRCLKRWGTVHGLRAGTSDGEQARILAARWIHIHTVPHTQPDGLHFTDDTGIPWSEEATATMIGHQRSFAPFGLAGVRGMCEIAFREIVSTTPDQSLMRQAVLEKYDEPVRVMGMRGFFGGPMDFLPCLYRAISTVLGVEPSGVELDDYELVAGIPSGVRGFMLPVCADAPWLIAAMPPHSVPDAAAWTALPFEQRFLC